MRHPVIQFFGLIICISALIYACKSDTGTAVTPSSAIVSGLTCGSATFSATTISGTAYTGTATIPYTGGNGVTYAAGSAIASTGVVGLNATLQAGTLSTGAGKLTFSISGTPSGSGTATFAISFGGQTCALAVPISLSVITPGSSTGVSGTSSLSAVVAAAEAFKATLTASQLALVQLAYSKTDALKWSNLPDGLYNGRVGIKLSVLNATQLAAFYTLMGTVMARDVTNEGLDELEGGLVADDYLGANGGSAATYSRGNFHVAFLGTPSNTGLWELQFGGHHYTFANTYNNGKVTGVTPSFRAVEPMATITANNRTYQPVEQERAAFAALLMGLSSTEQATAKLAATYSDVLLGPGKDGQFPTAKSGVKVGDLTAAKKELVLNAIKLYVNDLDAETAATILAKYTSEIDNTYVAYSGTTAVTSQNDYIRIDGPSIWIEFSYQGGIVIRNTPHPHSVWRDRTGDYGGN
ncbi:DUF3500 domain-containing protein [Spirosoma montaniterrae]|uniref:DUF3500 domain-containing protein n=1 Tax=Spirosoma montaniterrae TaxID=1178516 RepID=A0A1P9WTU5_9BACT|nr:DUF3500 domain-containing protein [Spirosoma montaniterrae]AQG78805.1 hypothetical protein AWR27_05375 [Spirosoma montaniterrae]